MSETVLCTSCCESIEIPEDFISEYYEHSQETSICVIECPHCETKNSISWIATVEFNSREADEEDIQSHKDKF